MVRIDLLNIRKFPLRDPGDTEKALVGWVGKHLGNQSSGVDLALPNHADISFSLKILFCSCC